MVRARAAVATLSALAVLGVFAGCGADQPSPVAPTASVSPGVTTQSTLDPTSTSPSTTTPSPGFLASISTVTAEDLYASWRPGCPVAPINLRAVDLTFVGVDGADHQGRIVVSADLAPSIVEVFGDLYAARFPIERIEPIDVYGGDDNRSISANNTSGFNCRLATGGTGWSEHAYGRAIDINPLVNPYVRGATVLPPEAVPYADRGRSDPGMIHADDVVVRSMAARGWQWGGSWTSLKDYQHFSTSGR